VWCELLRAVPAARLLLVRHVLRGETAEEWRERFRARGLPAGRVELRSVEAVDLNHLRQYADIDVALDAFPWNGHTTACEALWMGVPVVTLRGNRHAGRMVASLLTCIGLPELVAETAADYVRIAAALAADLPRMAALRSELRQRLAGSPLCDGPGFTAGLEAAYRRMWRRCVERTTEPAAIASGPEARPRESTAAGPPANP
jgi:predicted O-linked N-acetylglucosamine transferase (SPINDLY family)